VTPGRHFSKPRVASTLASLLATERPLATLDLCSGDGALTDVLPGLRVASVDLDPRARASGTEHHVADALDPGLASMLRTPGGFDLVACNPPYGSIPDTTRARSISGEAGMPHPGRPATFVDSAWTFCARAVALARPGGTVVLVVPDGLATGLLSRPFRDALTRRHRLRHAVSLPERSFVGTDARAVLLILSKDTSPAPSVAMASLSPDGRLSDTLHVPVQAATNRLDHAYHAVMSGIAGPTLESLGARVARGRLPPGARDGCAFGTGSFPDGHRRSAHVLTQDALSHGMPFVAVTGDILVARVDRHLHRKVCLVSSGSAAPTDQVLRIRLPPDHVAAVARALISPEGEDRLRATSRGTGARTLSTVELMRMPLPLRMPPSPRADPA